MQSGVLLYCFDTPQCAYSRIAHKTVPLIQHHLDLPVTVVTDSVTAESLKGLDVDTIIGECSQGNTKMGRPWYNLERHLAYEHSPYDRTLVLDVDYFVFSKKLLTLMDAEDDFLIHSAAFDLTHRQKYTYDRESMMPLVWATVLIFSRGNRAKSIFDMVRYVKDHYKHFCNLYRISYTNFRNDYAFAIALNQLSGHRAYSVIPDAIATLPADSQVISMDNTGLAYSWLDRCSFVADMDVHVLNKEVALV